MGDIQFPAGVQLTGGSKTGSRQVVIRSHLPHVEPRSGLVCVCPDCEGEVFAIWQIDGQTALHLQCVNCGQVYCCGHDCAEEAREDAETEGGGLFPDTSME